MTEDSRIRYLDIEEELKESYLTYTMSVIIQRALPDVRDGLKPSQRRILVSMNDLNLRPTGGFLKCAKIAGDTSGNYHPHGESVVYPTLVRMAQPWNMRYRLVEGQGNFGSPDGDPPAAMRYTEARLTGEAVDLMEDLDKETVDYVSNFDGRLTEPTVLPSKFPNLLVNGSSGIAVGMATSLPPHNLNEVLDVLQATVKNPDITVDEILKILPGPDFPTGGIICGRNGIRRAYKTGRGQITVRSRIEEEQKPNGRVSFVVTETPYLITKSKVIESIVRNVKAGTISGISDVRDESDQRGQRLVIELKRGEDPPLVLNQLYKFSLLQTSCSLINLALVDGKPKTLSIKEVVTEFISHRFWVIRRRTGYLLRKAEARAHILEGLLKALQMIDEIIAVIKASANPREAGENLMDRFGFTEPQATHIRQMPLQSLTGLERQRLQKEYDDLMEKIVYWRRVMAEDPLVYEIMNKEWDELRKKYGDSRRTSFEDAFEEFEDEDLIPVDSVVVTVTQQGYVKRSKLSEYRSQGRGGVGIRASGTKEGDFVRTAFFASTHDYLLFFTNKGRVLWLKVYRIPELDRSSRGRAIVNLIDLEQGEEVAQEICISDLNTGYLLFGTKKGVVKRTELQEYGRPRKIGIYAIVLDPGDELISVSHCTDENDAMLITKNGQANRFQVAGIRPLGRKTRGVRGISLCEGDQVVSMVTVKENEYLCTVCRRGFGKRTEVSRYRKSRRAGKGVVDIQTGERNGEVVGAQAVVPGDDLVVVTRSGQMIRVAAADVSVKGRGTKGVRVVRLRQGDEVASVKSIPAEVLKEAEGPGDSEGPETPHDPQKE